MQFRACFRRPMTGQQAPEVVASYWFNGNAVTLESMRGNLVLLDFWAVWCAPCMEKLPEIDKLYRTYRSRGLAVIGIHDASTDSGQIQRVLAQKKVTYPVARDTDSRDTYSKYGILGIPHMILVGKDGTIIADGKSFEQTKQIIQRELGAP